MVVRLAVRKMRACGRFHEALRYHTTPASSFPYSVSFFSDMLQILKERVTYHCNGDGRRIGEYEFDFLELPPSAPILGKTNPIDPQLDLRLVDIYVVESHHPAPLDGLSAAN